MLLSGASAVLMSAFQLVLQTDQDLVQEVRQEGITEDKEASSGPGGDPTSTWVHLDDVDILLTQSLVTWGGQLYKSRCSNNNMKGLTHKVNVGLVGLPEKVVKP